MEDFDSRYSALENSITVMEFGHAQDVSGIRQYVSYCGCTNGEHRGVYRSTSPHDLPAEWNIHPVQVVAYEVIQEAGK